MSEHTPIPWHVRSEHPANETLRESAHARRSIDTPRGTYYLDPKGSGPPPAEIEANAAFIVRACNAHAQMLQALEELIAEHDNEAADVEEERRAYVQDTCGIEMAHAAITKATQETAA